MKKLFLLIPALVLSLALSAEVIQINTGTADALRKALNNAQSGDIIEMAAGMYVESNSNWIAFTNKNVTVRAAEGAEVILQPKVSIRLKEGATAEFIGIKFDCGHLSDLASYSDVIFPADATDGKNIILRNCEFYGWTQNNAIIYSASSNTLNSLIIENCYFHDVTKSCVFLENQTNAVNVQITNSTFANIATVTGSYYAGVIDMRSTTGSLLVDHCTFYNVQAMSTDYAAIGKIGSGTTAVVSNCIFAMPTNTSGVRTIRDAVTANNCLVYNYSNDSGYGMQSNVTKNNCTIADPLFADAANGDFSLAGDWTTMTLSPARGAATDGSDLGDPRWYSAEVLPSSNFVAPYVFLGEKALLSGSFALNGDSYIQSQDKSYAGVATWKIHSERQGVVEVTLNIAGANTSGHRYEVALYDANNALVGTALAEPSNSWSHGDKVLGTYAIPTAGDYTVKLTNDCSHSSTILEGLTFVYIGGTTMNVPADELIGEEAVLVDNGHMKVSKLENGDLKYGDNSDPLGEYVYWNINATKYGRMDVTLNVVAPGEGNPSGHKFLVELYSDLNGEPIASTAEPSQTNATGEIAMPALNIPATGNYIVKLTNQKEWSSAILHSIELAYAGGEVANVPGQILGADALLYKSGSKYMIRTEEGYLKSSNNGSPTTEWAVWNITASAGALNVTLNLDPVTSSGHNYRVELYQGEELKDYTQELESAEGSAAVHTKGNIALEKTLVVPADGSYTIKLVNRTQWSSMILQSITFAEVVPPTVVAMDEMAEDNTAWISYKDGDAINVQLTRTIVAGMYNTICLPFDVDGTQTKAIFGSDVELYTLGTTAYENEVLTLNVDPASDIYHGTPYLIKTSADVVNPLFEGVQILSEVPANTSSTYVDFIGNFIKSEVPAGENNLFLGPNDLLYFSQTATPIKGMRAYFRVNVPSAANAVKRARIVAQGQVVTAIDLVGAESKSFKTIENGQLIITIDGVRYNVMGAKIQ